MDGERTRLTQMNYHIEVKGILQKNWKEWLDGNVEISKQAQTTTITAVVPDQAALRGILNQLWDLNLTLVRVNQMAGDRDDE